MVCGLKRTLNGLLQAPRAWHMRLREELGNFEFVTSITDTRIVAGELIYLVVWVDDIPVAARGGDCIAKAKEYLGGKFAVRDLGEAKYFLGMELTQPTEEHWRAALGVVRYLAGTAEDGVIFGGSGENFTVYCDADHAGDVDTKRSTTGYVFLMYGRAVLVE
ncbi:hypothetical protein KFL_013820020 [Klebsormidium nitens]|uniref:Reverse transcriptase Ty1/copia-type domain-containing protein n=1 Tax=Klebsormidium nitens TaxID=105231 RepID=A0A1Y1IQV8_KLENI|nr:hypothetical protein KFL_013820020 [Klebsormidium nitens]|eukprot:GAQ93240.1 hypothetical protein KFL_013820020 [Klebsormidium nitens]